jgi:hypothetical protein
MHEVASIIAALATHVAHLLTLVIINPSEVIPPPW